MAPTIPWEFVNIALNLILVVGGGIVSFFLRGMTQSVADLKNTDTALQAKVAAIEVMIAGNYVTRGEFQHDLDKISNAIFAKLDRIEAKVDQKADK